MNSNIDIVTIITVAGIIQSIFLSLIFAFIKKGNQRANRMMAMLLFCLAISITNSVLIRIRWLDFCLVNFSTNITLLFGPFILFYVRLLIEHNYRFARKDILHFLPFIIIFVYFFKIYFSDINFKNSYVATLISQGPLSPGKFDVTIILIITQIHMWTYIYKIRRLLIRHEEHVKQFYSTIEEMSLRWVRFIIAIFSMVYLTLIALFIFAFSHYRQIGLGIVGVVVTTAIYYFAYKGLKQPEILFSLEFESCQRSVPNEDNVVSDLHRYYQQLDRLMIDDKVYRNPGLSLMELAKILCIPRSLLSQVINEIAGVNFFDYINKHRVEEAGRLMVDPKNEHLTIVAIGSDAGFNSKASFNRAFKKFTQMTPSEYRRLHQNQSNQYKKNKAI